MALRTQTTRSHTRASHGTRRIRQQPFSRASAVAILAVVLFGIVVAVPQQARGDVAGASPPASATSGSGAHASPPLGSEAGTAPTAIVNGDGSPSAGRGRASFKLTVGGGNKRDTVSGQSWVPDETVQVYIDVAEGAELIGSFTADSSGAFRNKELADFSKIISLAGDSNFSGENFPIIAMGAQGDAATIKDFTASYTSTEPIPSSDPTVDGGCSNSPGGRIVPFGNPAPAILPATGLSTQGSSIVYNGKQVHLASVNWYGAEEADFVPGGLQCQSVSTIASEFKDMGFNSVRLPWSNAMEEQDPSICPTAPALLHSPRLCIPSEVLTANITNPQLGNTALGIFEYVVKILTKDHLMVILDNHSTDAAFTPEITNSFLRLNLDGIWWGGQYWDNRAGGFGSNPSGRTTWWVSDWMNMARLFRNNQYVIGADLRNEPSKTPYGCPIGPFWCNPDWGSGGSNVNWLAAAERAGSAVLKVDPHLLIIVEGLNWSQTFPMSNGKITDPVVLRVHGRIVQDRVVYSAHEYPGDFFGLFYFRGTSSQLWQSFDNNWGYLVKSGSAPVWIGEFGTTVSTVSGPGCSGDNVQIPKDDANLWLSCFEYYELAGGGDNWSWWGVNGTASDGGIFSASRTFYDREPYGVLNTSWDRVASGSLMSEFYCLEYVHCAPS